MKLDIKTTKKSQLFYVVKSFRDKNGRSTSKIIEKLGTYDELKERLSGEDPIEWAKNYVLELNIKEKEEQRKVIVEFSPAKHIRSNEQSLYNGGYLFLQQIYHELGLHKICKDISKRYQFDFNLNSILSRLVYGRILFPASKLATHELSKKFIEQPDFDSHQIYRALSVLSKESDFIQSALYKNSLKLGERKSKVIYYDCTNYYFEIEVAEGLKQYGVSKENKPNPIVQMGLFMDMDGLPLAFCINPGNTNEQVTLRPLEKKLMAQFDLSKFVVCTDAGLSSLENRIFNSKGDKAFITTQSLKQLVGHIKAWALERNGWKITGDDRLYNIDELDQNVDYSKITFYKERWMNEKGLEQRIIVTYSTKYKEFIRRKRIHQIERAQNQINSNPSKINSKRNTDYKRFIEQTKCTEDGEIATLSQYSINTEKINEEEKYDGLYAVCTNLKGGVSDIIKVNHRRWEIEESFRIMKTEFKARPVYLKRDDRIIAHFLTCFLALMVFRMLEKKIEYKYSCEKIIDSIRNMNFYDIKGEGYIPTYTRTDIIDDLHQAMGFRTDYEIITKQKMKKIVKITKG